MTVDEIDAMQCVLIDREIARLHWEWQSPPQATVREAPLLWHQHRVGAWPLLPERTAWWGTVNYRASWLEMRRQSRQAA